MKKNSTQSERDSIGKHDSEGKKIIISGSASAFTKPPVSSPTQPEKKTTTLHVTLKDGKKESPVPVLDDNAANAPTAK